MHLRALGEHGGEGGNKEAPDPQERPRRLVCWQPNFYSGVTPWVGTKRVLTSSRRADASPAPVDTSRGRRRRRRDAAGATPLAPGGAANCASITSKTPVVFAKPSKPQSAAIRPYAPKSLRPRGGKEAARTTRATRETRQEFKNASVEVASLLDTRAKYADPPRMRRVGSRTAMLRDGARVAIRKLRARARPRGGAARGMLGGRSGGRARADRKSVRVPRRSGRHGEAAASGDRASRGITAASSGFFSAIWHLVCGLPLAPAPRTRPTERSPVYRSARPPARLHPPRLALRPERGGLFCRASSH